MRLHSPFTPTPLFALLETCVQIELLVGVDEDLQTLRTATATATAEQGQSSCTVRCTRTKADRAYNV